MSTTTQSKIQSRIDNIQWLFDMRPDMFCSQGKVVATWRTVNGVKHGPYYALRYRDDGQQRSIYLGQCQELVEKVREMLAKCQQRYEQKLMYRKLRTQVRKSLREHRRVLLAELEKEGLTLKGYEIRGIRQWEARKKLEIKWRNYKYVDPVESIRCHLRFHPPSMAELLRSEERGVRCEERGTRSGEEVRSEMRSAGEKPAAGRKLEQTNPEFLKSVDQIERSEERQPPVIPRAAEETGSPHPQESVPLARYHENSTSHSREPIALRNPHSNPPSLRNPHSEPLHSGPQAGKNTLTPDVCEIIHEWVAYCRKELEARQKTAANSANQTNRPPPDRPPPDDEHL